jgi:prolyl-tRNA synthetase
VGLKDVEVIADQTVRPLRNAIAGGNADDTHLINVNPGRDFTFDRAADIRLVQPGDACPRCGRPLKIMRGIEVGHIFKLGTKYSKVLHATFLDENGAEKPAIMGCYGIGITRMVAAAIEQNNDDKGIIWPVSIAPYHAVVVPISGKDTVQQSMAAELYSALWQAGVETVLDDRDERPGVKFKDADLIGFPFRVTIGKKAAEEGKVELKVRKTGEEMRLSPAEAVAWLKAAAAGKN